MKRLRWLLAVLILTASLLPVGIARAGTLTARKLTLSTSAVNTSGTWTFEFTTSATTALNGVAFQVCDTPSGTCNIPGSWTNSGSAAGTITGIGTGFTLDNAAGFLRIKNNANATTVTNPVSIAFNTVTNPNSTGTFYVRITTYSGDDYTSAVDTGAVASSTANQITLTGTVDESLTFCVGVTVTSNCSSTTGPAASWIASSTFSSAVARTATSQFAAATNAESGYAVTVSGSTLTCDSTSSPSCSPSQSISALASQTASSAGTEQFGFNLRANTAPATFGADKSGGSASVNTNYNTANQYRFVAGDTIASHTNTTDFTVFTAGYIANISALTEAGQYKTTLTFVCTPTF